MAENKQFINGIWIREKKFDNGGSILSVSVKGEAIDDICRQLKQLAAESGWARLTIGGLRNPTEKSTHSIYVDTWKPKKQIDNSGDIGF